MSTENQANPAEVIAKDIKSAVDQVNAVAQKVEGAVNEIKSFQDFQKEVKFIEEKLEAKQNEEVKSLKMEIDALKEKQKKSVAATSNEAKDVKSMREKLEHQFSECLIKGEKPTEEYKSLAIEYTDAVSSKEEYKSIAPNLVKELKAIHNTNDYSFGGILLNAPVILGIQERLFISSPLRQYANVVSGREETAEMIISEKLGEANFMDETEDYNAQNINMFGTKTVTAIQVGNATKFTQKLDKFYANANRLNINLATLITEKLIRNISIKLNAGYINGVQTQKGGIIEPFVPVLANTYEKTSAYVFDGQKVGFVKSGFANTFDFTSLANLEAVLPSEYLTGSVFMMNPKTLAVIKNFKDNTGMPLFNQNTGLGLTNGVVKGTLFGYPVVVEHHMPDVVTNSLPIFFGVPKAYYTIYDAFGDTFLERRNPSDTGQTVTIVASKYSTGIVSDPQAGIFLKISA